MDKTPRPIQIIFFLLLLLVFSSMIPFMLHIFGVHCTYEGDIVTTSPLSVITNIKLALIDADEIFNRTSYVPDTIGFDIVPIDVSCRVEVCHVPTDDPDIWYYSDNQACDNITPRWIFKSEDWEWARCVVCSGDTNFTVLTGSLSSVTDYYCYGDAYPIADDDKSWFQDWVCKPDQRCVPPPNYYWESDTGTYDCIDAISCGQNLTGSDIIPFINQELNDAGAELLYTKTDGIDDRSAIMFACTQKLQPQITFYGIPVFDYRTWLILIVLAVMFIFLSNIQRH